MHDMVCPKSLSVITVRKSETFKEYVPSNAIHHQRVTAKWAQANGEVERQIRSIVKRLKVAQIVGKD